MSKILFKILIVSFIFCFFVSLDENANGQQTGQQTGRHIVTNGPDFATPFGRLDNDYIFPDAQLPKGYQSTAAIELKFYENGRELTPGETVWTITGVQNKVRSWNRDPGAMHGLAWGDSEIDGTTNWNATPVIGGPSITTSNGAVELSDVVGERLVTLKAETTINGALHTETIEVSFGEGPLSVFAEPPSSKGMEMGMGMQWATASGVPAKADSDSGDFTALADPSDFPAAAFCGGAVHSGSSDIAIGGSRSYSFAADFTAGKSLNHWRDGDVWSNVYYSTTSKLPTLGQLVAVSAYDGFYRPDVKRKGAALAAGWPDDVYNLGNYRYWTGQVFFYSTGDFHADYVLLSNGDDYRDDYVTDAAAVVACVE